MIRTQIQLEEAQYRQLRSLGNQTGKGLAEQVREAVGLYLTRQRGRSEPHRLGAGEISSGRRGA
jgi:hypothetical protein